MHFMSFYMNSRKGTHRTQILAGSTANAGVFVDSRNRGRQFVVRVRGNHLYGSRRTVACAVATLCLACSGDTEISSHHGVAYLYARLFLFVNEMECASRTHL